MSGFYFQIMVGDEIACTVNEPRAVPEVGEYVRVRHRDKTATLKVLSREWHVSEVSITTAVVLEAEQIA